MHNILFNPPPNNNPQSSLIHGYHEHMELHMKQPARRDHDSTCPRVVLVSYPSQQLLISIDPPPPTNVYLHQLLPATTVVTYWGSRRVMRPLWVISTELAHNSLSLLAFRRSVYHPPLAPELLISTSVPKSYLSGIKVTQLKTHKQKQKRKIPLKTVNPPYFCLFNHWRLI